MVIRLTLLMADPAQQTGQFGYVGALEAEEDVLRLLLHQAVQMLPKLATSRRQQHQDATPVCGVDVAMHEPIRDEAVDDLSQRWRG